MKVVLPIGSSLLVFETAVTSILRVSESFEVDEVLLLVPKFANNYLRDIINFLQDIGFKITINYEEITPDISYDEIDKYLNDGGILVPSASSVIYIIKFVSRATKLGNRILHISFPFGPWLGLYYPYVPRFILKIAGGKKEVRKVFDYNLAKQAIDKWLKNRELSKIIARESLDYNIADDKNYLEDEDVELCLTREGKVNTEGKDCILNLRADKNWNLVSLTSDGKSVTFLDFLKEFKDSNTKEGTVRSLAGELGLYSIGVMLDDEKYNIRELSKKFRGIIVDTNLIYNGIALYPDLNLLLPYCAYVEVSNNRASIKRRRSTKVERAVEDLAWIETQEILSRFGIIPTQTFFCDAIMSMIDPLLLRDTLILTDDEGAYNHWRNVITNATVGKLYLEEEKNGAYLSYSLLLLSWVMRNYLK
ncbi:hypothetical protein [Acidianus sp. HS-5]|uniref:hypothetical protein n=1 Tax=Acidianus sp. HS-5 TaxID=2886040 RepID=UPI001F3F95E9|nr:hypothetical protein [Acidianus sp. HS-5]BDC18803.1 hypothetical protein HS5_16930 [Acidianus sp. HS-5]